MTIAVTGFTSVAYDEAVYLARELWNSIMTAGSGGVSAKFVAHANIILHGLTTYTTIVGSSTYTGGLYGNPPGATLAIQATQLSVIRITNTAAAGATIALSTSTIGPFTVGGVFNGAGGTATNQVGAACFFPINTSSVSGGVAINAGDQIYIVNGTDASAVELITIDYNIAPLANMIA